MPDQTLPMFRYHPDPVGTGSLIRSDAPCDCCGRVRGFVYTGAIYGPRRVEALCPWCIADGSAHERLAVELTDRSDIGGDGAWEDVSAAVEEEVAYRTPGFSGWQQARWWTHCDDAAAYLGPAGKADVDRLDDDAKRRLTDSLGDDDPTWQADVLAGLSRDGSPVAFLFRCLTCGQVGGYIDFN